MNNVIECLKMYAELEGQSIMGALRFASLCVMFSQCYHDFLCHVTSYFLSKYFCSDIYPLFTQFISLNAVFQWKDL